MSESGEGRSVGVEQIAQLFEQLRQRGTYPTSGNESSEVPRGIIESVFAAVDVRASGHVDIREFLSLFSILCRGTIDERMGKGSRNDKSC